MCPTSTCLDAEKTTRDCLRVLVDCLVWGGMLFLLSRKLQRNMAKYFSYCIPSITSSTGYLSFGKPRTGKKRITYTQLLHYSGSPSFYFISLQGFMVGRKKLKKLRIQPAVFRFGALIDSGNVISRLPPTAYTALAKEYAKQMLKYPRAPAYSILSVCFDLSGYKKVTVPIVALVFSGNVMVNLGAVGTLYVINSSQACLAFAGNSDTTRHRNPWKHSTPYSKVVFDFRIWIPDRI